MNGLNRRYREKFGFPCIVALRLHANRESVMREMERRLGNNADTELADALSRSATSRAAGWTSCSRRMADGQDHYPRAGHGPRHGPAPA